MTTRRLRTRSGRARAYDFCHQHGNVRLTAQPALRRTIESGSGRIRLQPPTQARMPATLELEGVEL